MLRRSLLLLTFALVSCKTAETPAVAATPTPTPTPAPTLTEPAKPVVPAVTLPAAAPLPKQPLGMPPFKSPEDNALTAERAELGWKLFFDKRLSKDGSTACEGCHHIASAYTSGNVLDAKVGGAMNKRNTPSVLNLVYQGNFYWDGRTPTLEAVSNAAWKGQLGADPATVVKTLNDNATYKALFERAYGSPATPENVPKALASFFRALQSGNSPWDKFMEGDTKAMSKEAQEGWKVFGTAGCTKCHTPPLFTDLDFHAVGIGDDPGRKDATKADADTGKFKTPALRNVALTAPYFHDGHAKTLDDAIALMVKGGAKPGLDPALVPAKLSPKELASLKAFLESLSGESTYTTEPTLP